MFKVFKLWVFGISNELNLEYLHFFCKRFVFKDTSIY
jgi:hypothetical protein